MTNEEIKKECEILIGKIKDTISKNGKDLRNFLINYLEARQENIEDKLKAARTIEKRFARIKKFKTATPKSLELIRDIYNFLQNPEYEPLKDSSYEEKILGKELYDKIVENNWKL